MPNQCCHCVLIRSPIRSLLASCLIRSYPSKFVVMQRLTLRSLHYVNGQGLLVFLVRVFCHLNKAQYFFTKLYVVA